MTETGEWRQVHIPSEIKSNIKDLDKDLSLMLKDSKEFNFFTKLGQILCSGSNMGREGQEMFEVEIALVPCSPLLESAIVEENIKT